MEGAPTEPTRRSHILVRSRRRAARLGHAIQIGVHPKYLTFRRTLARHALGRILVSVVNGYFKDRVSSHAAAMTYYGIFSLFPLILLFVSLTELALQSATAARTYIVSAVATLLPERQEALHTLITGVVSARGTVAGVGFLALLWSAFVWFQEVDTNVNEIWGVSKPRSYFRSLILAVTLLALVVSVALISFIATGALNLIAEVTGEAPGRVWLWQVAVSVVSILTLACLFFILYRYTPQRRVQFADIWPAALTMATLWEASRRLLALYLETLDFIHGYGPIGAAMALLIWIYVAMTLVLLGAELTYAIAKERRHIPSGEEMDVVAPPGEQPTPKFAPQIGHGPTTGLDQPEPAIPPPTAAPSVRSSG